MQAYASVQLNADLGLSDYVYGLGSGIFFLGYMVFQVQTSLHAHIYFCPPMRSSQHPRGACLAARLLHCGMLGCIVISQRWTGMTWLGETLR